MAAETMMRTLVYADFGMEIYESDGYYWMRYDAGEIVDELVEIAISKLEVERAKRSERDAYEIIVAHEHERRRVDL